MAGIKVILSDLKNFSHTLHHEAHTYRGLRDNISPEVADSGDRGLDHSVNAIADLITGLHEKLAVRMDAHADNVKHAHDSFQRQDIDVHGVFEDLTDDMGEGLSK